MAAVLVLAFWCVATWGVASRRPVLVYLFFATLPLGTFAVVPPAALGGISLVAPTMAALLLAAKELALAGDGGRFLTGHLFHHELTRLLTAFWLGAFLVTVFVPRYRAGDITIIPLSGNRYVPTPLQPTAQNITQLAYLTVSVLAVVSFARAFSGPARRPLLLHGILVAGAVTVLTGAVDLLSSWLPLAPALAPFRTAQYQIIDHAQLGDGTKRVIGLMPEASAYGHLAMALFTLSYFLRPAVADERLRRWFGHLSIGLAVMLVLSTSSAGYAAVAVAIGLMGLHWTVRTANRDQVRAAVRRGSQRELFTALGLVFCVVALALVHPDAFDPVLARIHDVVLAKRQSDSYVERNMWTAVSFRAGLASDLLGVGLGSTRASNFAVVLFASTGLAGVVLYTTFALRLLLRRPAPGLDDEGRGIVSALRWSFLPVFTIELLIATTPDFGVVEALRWGVLTALLERPRAVAASLLRPLSIRSRPLALSPRPPTVAARAVGR